MNSGEASLGKTDSSRRVCVLFPGALGDFVCFLPALHELARLGAVDLIARSEFAAIAPRAVTVHSLERSEVRRLFTDAGATDPSVQRFFSRYAAVFSWFASDQLIFLEQLQKVSHGCAHIFPFRPKNSFIHQADYYLSCVDPDVPNAPQPLVALRADALLWCDSFCRRTEIDNRPLLVMAPGSGAREKNWPEANYVQVMRWWREQFAGNVVVVMGPVETERHRFDQLASSGCIIASELDLAQLASLLSRCNVYVGNDSGVSHLAAAVGARTVVIFGPSDERKWAPRGPRVSIVRRQVACSPCDDTAMKLCPHRACLTELTSAEAIHELRKLPEIANLTRLRVEITV